MRTLAVVLVLLAAVPALAGEAEILVAPPADGFRAGEAAEFSVFVHNTGQEPVEASLPARLECRIREQGSRTFNAEALAVDGPRGPIILEPGCFLKGAYRLMVPGDLGPGAARLGISGLAAAPVLVAVSQAPAPAGEPALAEAGEGKGAEEPDAGDVPLDTLFRLYQPYVANIGAYQPMYFLVGTDPKNSSFQVSFKYRFFNENNPVAEKHPWLQGFHLGYTQTSFWDLKSESAPFKDTSYKPELFFVTGNAPFRPSWMTGLFLQTGIQHESNGRGGPESRSTNYVYARPVCIFYDPGSRLGMSFAPRFQVFVENDNETNPDLSDYRGYVELNLAVGKADSFVLGSHLRLANEGASLHLDLTYPLHRLFSGNFDLYAQVQYVNSLAESLITYQERTETVRLGFAIVR